MIRGARQTPCPPFRVGARGRRDPGAIPRAYLSRPFRLKASISGDPVKSLALVRAVSRRVEFNQAALRALRRPLIIITALPRRLRAAKDEPGSISGISFTV